jgi:hypothetical protein
METPERQVQLPQIISRRGDYLQQLDAKRAGFSEKVRPFFGKYSIFALSNKES